MKKSFACSIICQNGIIGGSLCVEDKAITYKTNKFTVDRKYRHLVLPMGQIVELSWSNSLLPVATFRMRDGERYEFLIFNKKRFDICYNEVKQDL